MSSMIEISKWMKDRKRIYDRKNIHLLEKEVAVFIQNNVERFKKVEKPELKAKKKSKSKSKSKSKKKEFKNELEADSSMETNPFNIQVED